MRDARKSDLGACDAMATAIAEPIDSGETPVIRTVISIS